MKQSEPATPDEPVTGAPEPSTKVYRDADGNECTLTELCRKEPEWAANVIAALEARWEKYTESGVEHPKQAPRRIWVQWMPRVRGAMVYMQPPAIVDGALGRYILVDIEGFRDSEGEPDPAECSTISGQKSGVAEPASTDPEKKDPHS